jgi:hypothetical protein
MPLQLPDNQTFDYFISAVDDHGLDGATLAAGQTDTVSSSDPNIVLVADTTLRPAPDGTASVASGKGSTANPVTNRAAITITSHIANADGTPGTNPAGAAIPDASDTVSIVAGLAATQGMLFGVPA